MKHRDIKPPQEQGASSDIIKTIHLKSSGQAKEHFKIVKNRLLNVSDWHNVSKNPSARFILTNSKGEEVLRDAKEGDMFKINIPAPGPAAGDGFDWVKIHSIKDEIDEETDSEFLAIMVKPAKNPTGDTISPAHFFDDKASSTFIVNRTGKAISAEVHGRNERPNVKQTGITDTIRNAVIALGAMLGFSKIQWEGLVKGLIAEEDSE